MRFRLPVLLAPLASIPSLALPGCEPWPRDPERTLERAAGGTLRVGASEAPPTLRRAGAGATGVEAELVEAFARSIDAQVDWRWGAQDAHLEALERYDLDLVVGGLTTKSPWKTRVGFTRPWLETGDTRHVMAVPPGENRALVALERVIESRRPGGTGATRGPQRPRAP
jgi:hypothetical protein